MKQAETSIHILIVDDERRLREGCRRTLARRGYQVDVAATGQEGLSKGLADHFDVILLNLRMPDIAGIELLKYLRVHNPDSICIVMSEYATVEVAVQAMKLGACDFISKPFSDDSLLLAVEGALEKRRSEKTAQALQGPPAASAAGSEKVALGQIELVKSVSMRRVAHELRAPVAAIRSFLTMILNGYATPEKTREWQQRAADRADDLLGLVDDLLNLARLRDPGFSPPPKCVSVEEILSDVLGLHVPEAESKGIRLRVETKSCPSIFADPMRIKQLWTNLISNAIKYTRRGGRVTIRLFSEGGTIVGLVQDTGIGISKEDLPRLFEEFFRADQAKAFAQHGTGLGLSIVKQIVTDYGGDIRVESELNKGTRFTFRLPAG